MSLATITGGGSFTFRNITDINANFAALETIDVWVRPQYGNNNGNGLGKYPLGSYNNAYATMSGVASILRPGLVIGLEGVLRENYAPPIVNNVTIIGVSDVPRQATTSGVPNGGGATWLSLATVANTSALVTVQGQGWTFANILFNNAATTAGCVKLSCVGDPPLQADASQCAFVNCSFTGTNLGIDDAGGSYNTLIDGCEFFEFQGTGDVAIKSTSTALRLPRKWRILNSRFFANVNHIVAPAWLWEIKGCVFEAATTVNIDFTGGTAPNFVQQNAFAIAAANFDPAGGVTGVSGDAWSNYLTDAVETGLPAN